jgi:hypothetical protein
MFPPVLQHANSYVRMEINNFWNILWNWQSSNLLTHVLSNLFGFIIFVCIIRKKLSLGIIYPQQCA